MENKENDVLEAIARLGIDLDEKNPFENEESAFSEIFDSNELLGDENEQ